MIDEVVTPTIQELRDFKYLNPEFDGDWTKLTGPIVMYKRHGDPICVYSITPHNNYIELHCLVSKKAQAIPLSFFKMTKHMISECFYLCKNYDILKMDVEESNKKWAEKLGFVPDFSMCLNQDGYFPYKIVRGGK